MHKMINEMIPATTSSIITPQPPDSFSADLTGKGLIISKNLKSAKPITKLDRLTGMKVKVIHCPTHSSITIREGSISFESIIIH